MVNLIQLFTDAYGGITDKDAAKILHVTPGCISNWRSGKFPINEFSEYCIKLHLEISQSHRDRIKERYI